MNILKEKYQQEVVPALKEKFGYKNILAVPKITHISLNVGLGSNFKDSKLLEVMESVLTRISGQKVVPTRAKKSISNFKIREGNVIGMKVTLRGNRMYDFLTKLIHVTLPRVRDFQGLKQTAINNKGNLAIGFTEYLPFPEIRSDEVEVMHGLEITIATSCKNYEEGYELFKGLGFPFKEN